MAAREAIAAAAVRILGNRGHMTALDLLRGVRAIVPGATLDALYRELVSLEALDEVHIAEPWLRKWGVR